MLPEAYETCGKGGGYIMAAGCIAENPKLENLQAIMEAIREYGVYRQKGFLLHFNCILDAF
jgi:hypothetical protein